MGQATVGCEPGRTRRLVRLWGASNLGALPMRVNASGEYCRAPPQGAFASTLIDENQAARFSMSASDSGLAISVITSCFRLPDL